MRTKKILLIGHAGFYNRGCEAIVRGTVEIIRHHLGVCEITLCSYKPEEDGVFVRGKGLAIDGIISDKFEGPPRFSPGWVWRNIDQRILCRNMGFQEYLHRKIYRKFDAVISIGGDNFTDDYGSARRYFRPLRYAWNAGVKTVVWAGSIGPFKKEADIASWVEIMRKVDLITVREKLSAEYLKSLGVCDNVRLVADPGFLLEPTKPADGPGRDISGGLVVGMGISKGIAFYSGISEDEYINAFAEFGRYIQERLKAKIVLVPHVIDESESIKDDFKACQAVAGRLSSEGEVVVLPGTYDAGEIKYCISQCDLFIGARTHSTIASLSTGVPTLSIGYSPKARGINLELFGTDEYLIAVNEVSCKRLIEVFDKIRGRSDEIRKQLLSVMPSVRSAAFEGGRYLAEILE